MIRFVIALALIVCLSASVEAGILKNRKHRGKKAVQKIVHPFKHCENDVCNLN